MVMQEGKSKLASAYGTSPRFRPGGLFKKDVAGGCFRILIDGDDDRLHMLIAPALSGRETARCFERLQDVDMLSGQWQNKNGAVASAVPCGLPGQTYFSLWLICAGLPPFVARWPGGAGSPPVSPKAGAAFYQAVRKVTS
jgi:hypothetical protein